MSLAQSVIAWLLDPVNWSGPTGIPTRVAEHVVVTAIVLVIALAVALPLGTWIGHSGRGITTAVAVSGGLRALPTLGVVTLCGIWFGIGLTAPVIALVILAVPPALAGTYAGLRAVDRDVVDVARAVGMTEWGIVRSVEVPLAMASIVAGIRSSTLQVVATVTVAAYVADDGLGRYIIQGLRTRRYDEMLAGSVLVIALAVLLDVVFALLARIAPPSQTNVRPERH